VYQPFWRREPTTALIAQRSCNIVDVPENEMSFGEAHIELIADARNRFDDLRFGRSLLGDRSAF